MTRVVGRDNRACLFRGQAQWAVAVTLCTGSLSLFEQAEGPQSFNVASLWVTLSDIYLKQNDYENSILAARQALDILDAVSQHLTSLDLSLLRVRALNWLGRAYCQTARYAEAETTFRAALDFSVAEFGQIHTETDLARGNLDGLYIYMGRPDQAQHSKIH